MMETWGRGVGGQGDKVQQSLIEKLVERAHSRKKRSLADLVPKQKINASTCKDNENVSLRHQKDTSLAEQPGSRPVLLKPRPQTQEG